MQRSAVRRTTRCPQQSSSLQSDWVSATLKHRGAVGGPTPALQDNIGQIRRKFRAACDFFGVPSLAAARHAKHADLSHGRNDNECVELCATSLKFVRGRAGGGERGTGARILSGNRQPRRAGCRSAVLFRHVSRLNFWSRTRRDFSVSFPSTNVRVHCATFVRSPRHAPRTNGTHDEADARLPYALPTRVHPLTGCWIIVKNTVLFVVAGMVTLFLSGGILGRAPWRRAIALQLTMVSVNGSTKPFFNLASVLSFFSMALTAHFSRLCWVSVR